MERLLITTLFLLFSVCVFGQDTFFETYQMYIDDCNELVNDTIEQSGTVNMKYVPVELNGEVDHFKLVPQDTVWQDYYCREYKDGILFTGGGNVWPSVNLIDMYGNITYITGSVIQSSEQLDSTTINISREVVCKIKKRMPSLEDFIERWCVEKKYIKLY